MTDEEEECGECGNVECSCHLCDECGEELNQWDRCPNRYHLSESEKRSEDLDHQGCEEYHASIYEDEDGNRY